MDGILQVIMVDPFESILDDDRITGVVVSD